MPIDIDYRNRIVSNNNVVREPDAKSHRDYIVVTVMASVFLLGLFAYGWQHYRWYQYGYRIEAAQKKKEQLSEVGRQLLLERASLRSPQRIDSMARRDLGMVVPAPGQLVTLRADAPLTIPVPQPPQPVPPQEASADAVQPQPAALASKR